MIGGRFLRRLIPGRRCKKLFLYSLPLTWHALFFGITDGLIITYFRHARVYEHTKLYINEVEADFAFEAFSVPGAPKLSDFPREPFYLAPLTNLDWFVKLNLTKPDEDLDRDSGIDRIAQLDGLRQEIDPALHSPTSHWIWVTELPFVLMPWDEAFDRLVQHHYVNFPAENASLSYVDCASAGFLCGVWGVKTPTLLRLSVDEVADGEYDSEPQYSKRGFKPGAFPTLFDQLLFYTSGEHDPDSIPEYNQADLTQDRAWEFFDELRKACPPFDVIHKVDDWMAENLPPLVDEFLGSLRLLVRTITWLLLYIPVRLVLTIWEETVGFS